MIILFCRVDDHILLEAAAVQAVVSRCAGNRIECTLVVLLGNTTIFIGSCTVSNITGSRPVTTIQIDTLVLPVFIIRNSCICISIGRGVFYRKRLGIAGSRDNKRSGFAVSKQRFTICLCVFVNRTVSINDLDSAAPRRYIGIFTNLNTLDCSQKSSKLSVRRIISLHDCLITCLGGQFIGLQLKRSRVGSIATIGIRNCQSISADCLIIAPGQLAVFHFKTSLFLTCCVCNSILFFVVAREVVCGKSCGLRCGQSICNTERICKLLRYIRFCFNRLDPRVGDHFNLRNRLTHHGSIVRTIELIPVRLRSFQTNRPCKLIVFQPNIFQVTQAIACAVAGLNNDAIYRAKIDRFAILRDFYQIIAPRRIRRQRHICGHVRRSPLHFAKGLVAVLNGQFLIHCGSAALRGVIIIRRFRQVSQGNAAQIRLLHTNRELDAFDLYAAFALLIIRTCELNRFCGRSRRNCVYAVVVVDLRLVELSIGDIHQHILVAGGRAAAAGRGTAAVVGGADGFGFAGFHGLVAGLDVAGAGAGGDFGVGGGDGGVAGVGLDGVHGAAALDLAAGGVDGDAADLTALVDGEGGLLVHGSVGEGAVHGQVSLDVDGAQLAAVATHDGGAVGILDGDPVGACAAGDGHTVGAASKDYVTLDGNTVKGNAGGAISDHQVSIDCDIFQGGSAGPHDYVAGGDLGDRLCGGHVGFHQVVHHLGKLGAGHVALGVELAVGAVDVPGLDQGGGAAHSPAGDGSAVAELAQGRGIAVGERKRTGQDCERLLPGDRSLRVELVSAAYEGAHLHGLAHVVVVPGALQHIDKARQVGGLLRAEGTVDDGSHLRPGQGALGIDLSVGPVQQAVFYRVGQRVRGPIRREI